MLVLITGLVVFFAIHSVRIVAPDWRQARIATMGEGAWKGLYSLVSLIGLALIIWGYGIARGETELLFVAPHWLKMIALGLMAISMILVVAAELKPGRIKQAVKHPMLLAVKIWALAHLIFNGDTASLVLFGTFLAWAIWDRIVVKRRGQSDPVATSASSDFIAIVVGLAIYGVLVMFLHQWLFGVAPVV